VFYLKQYDTVLLSFEILEDPLEGQKCRIHEIDEAHANLLPVGLKKTDEGLMSWLRSRIIPKNREYVDALLAKSGLSHNDTKGILQVCRGLSLNDSYWVVEEGFNGKYADYNLYEHDFVKVLSLIAYTGYGSSSRAKGFSSSPEFTTTGMLRKGWRRLGGKVLLFKGGTSGAANTGNEPYSEFYAWQVAKTIGVKAVEYKLTKWKGQLCSTCELFTSKERAFLPVGRVVTSGGMNTVRAYYEKLGVSFLDALNDMLVFDAIICNVDRHYGNFGFLVDNENNTIAAPAPLFDHGNSLFNFAGADDLENEAALDVYVKTLVPCVYDDFLETARSVLTEKHRQALRRLLTFRFKKHPRHNLPDKRLRLMEKEIQKRARALLS
jgi:hypothetical protein